MSETGPTCPNLEYHGNPFRYCACGWIEPEPDAMADTMSEPLNLAAWRQLLRVADGSEYAAACRWAVPALLSELEQTRAERDEAYGRGRDDEAAELPMRYPIPDLSVPPEETPS